VVRAPEKRGAPFWTLARRRFHCRNCGAQLRNDPALFGYAVAFLIIVTVAFNVFALAGGHYSWPAFRLGDIVVLVILAICDIRWGHTLRLAEAR
jgi:hypothetical protein